MVQICKAYKYKLKLVNEFQRCNTMEESRDKSGKCDLIKNYEGPSMSELDRGFITDCSLSALAIEGLLKPPRGIVVEYPDAKPTLPSFNRSCGTLSPSNAPIKNSLSPFNVSNKSSCLLSPNNACTSGLSNLVEGMSSTPYERVTFQKPFLASSLDLSCIDLTASHPSWGVSFIKPSVDSPKPCLDASELEPTWSFQSAPLTLEEISSLIWSGTPPSRAINTTTTTTTTPIQDSNQKHAVLELTEEQQKSLSKKLAM